MEDTVEEQGLEPSTNENSDGLSGTLTQEQVGENSFYKTFKTKEEFDKHSLGVLNSAKKSAEKELLSLLGLKLDEKDKLVKFKEAYDATLSESEKQAAQMQTLTGEVEQLKSQLSEKEAVILALSKFSGKSDLDVQTVVKMAKGLVNEETSIDEAIGKVVELYNHSKTTVPTGENLKPAGTDNVSPKNVFLSGNLTEQAILIKNDKEKAKTEYFKAFGKMPNWD